MGKASDELRKIIDKMNTNDKALAVFTTDIGGKSVDWEMTFQFNLDNEDPFSLGVVERKVTLADGVSTDAPVVMSGDNEAIVRICQGKGDFTHAISREQITVKKGKVMDVIRLTRAITIVLKTK